MPASRGSPPGPHFHPSEQAHPRYCGARAASSEWISETNRRRPTSNCYAVSNRWPPDVESAIGCGRLGQTISTRRLFEGRAKVPEGKRGDCHVADQYGALGLLGGGRPRAVSASRGSNRPSPMTTLERISGPENWTVGKGRRPIHPLNSGNGRQDLRYGSDILPRW